MGEALFELQQALGMKQLTLEEANILQTCKSKAVKDFSLAAAVGAGVAWAATWKLNKYLRVNISAGASFALGLWRFGHSLDSCVDHILAMDGSRMQEELAKILLTKHQNDPQTLRHFSKHFFSERVFDDSTSDQPKRRWRHRNYFSDNVAYGQRMHDTHSHSHSKTHSNSHHESHDYGAYSTTRSDTEHIPESTRKGSDFKQVNMLSTIDSPADPLECIFGPSAAKEEIRHPTSSASSSKVHTHGHKRSHRRRRIHRQEVLMNSHHA